MISASNLTTLAPTRLQTYKHFGHQINFLATLAILQFLPPCEKLLTMKSKGLMPAKTKGKGDEGICFPITVSVCCGSFSTQLAMPHDCYSD